MEFNPVPLRPPFELDPMWPDRAQGLDDLVAVLVAAGGVDEVALSGRHRGDDGCTQLDHALQCAGILRVIDPDDIALQVAGLLHDVGHVLAPDRPADHGRVARRWMEPLLGPRVGVLVDLHVTAKRYLVSVDPTYRDRLSGGSVVSLAAQGGGLSPAERAAFVAEPLHREAIGLRRADDRAKVPGFDAGRVADWIPMLEAQIAAARHGGPRDRPR